MILVLVEPDYIKGDVDVKIDKRRAAVP